MVATDGSFAATEAVRSVPRLFRSSSRIDADLVYVIPELPLPDGATPGLEAQADSLRESYEIHMQAEADRVLDRSTEMVEDSSIRTRGLVRRGPPAEVLVPMGADYDATVIGARASDVPNVEGVGPVAARFISDGPGVVVIVRDPLDEPPYRVLAAVDGSDASNDALDALVRLVQLDEGEVDLLHVLETPWMRLGPEQDWMDAGATDVPREQGRRVREDFRRHADEVIEDARSRLESADVDGRVRVTEGIADREILTQAEAGDYDLIVVGATESGDVRHAELGSVSSRIAEHAPSSVLLAHHR